MNYADVKARRLSSRRNKRLVSCSHDIGMQFFWDSDCCFLVRMPIVPIRSFWTALKITSILQAKQVGHLFRKSSFDGRECRQGLAVFWRGI